ncbi:MAG TPA: gliding motility-associated C-terminal domain-containing protein [Phaeodactylibacter sp.]|nr:gliding motility-associated C-terminal domain-containing protein [Phaeodactylibacter sp.]
MKFFNLPRTFQIFAFVFVLLSTAHSHSFASVDSIYASIPSGQFGTSCVDATSFAGDIESISNFCPDQSGTYANFDVQNPSMGCIGYYGLGEGTSMGCFEICDDLGFCDTVYLFLNVSPPIPLNFLCDTLVAPEVINVSISDCAASANICLPIRFDLLNTLEVYDSGVLYANGITGCNIDTIVAYTYNNLFGQGAVGPYLLESWTINDVEYSGEFADVNALLDSMNVWDTLGTWVFDPDVPFTIKGGFSDNFYGSITASKPGVVNSTSIMGANYSLIPLGSEIILAQGQHLITIVDNATSCTDSVLINVVCMPNDYLSLQTYVNISGSVCVDTSDLVGNFATLQNVCPSSGIATDIFPNDVCVDWEALEEGNQQVCLVACDDLGFCDTTFIAYQVFDPQTDTIDVVMATEDSEYFCVDSTELFGLVNNYSVVLNPSITAVTLDTIDFCLEITSTVEGNDLVCVAICDDQGGCDTTCFNILIDNVAAGYPIANDDADSTQFNTPFVIDILQNDSFTIGDTVTILTPPSQGTVEVDTAGNYIYTPDIGTCGDDIFTYEICNNVGCDVATVSVYVECEQTTVYTGFSPNGDGVNDSFLIKGLGAYPNHKVLVYNRWGNMVFEGENYKSNWQGYWNGKPLPHGVYFYVVELHDEANTVLAGAVSIGY